MKTKSIWGIPGQFYWRAVSMFEQSFPLAPGDCCIVGASDGKFVLPLTRKGYKTICYDIDSVALMGGEKLFPKKRTLEMVPSYCPNPNRPQYKNMPTEPLKILGLKGRLDQEGLSKYAEIRCEDFYRNPPSERFGLVFTSCSLQYKANRSMAPGDLLAALGRAVTHNGYLAMEYMMPLENTHSWKAPHYFRHRELRSFFPDRDWEVCYNREERLPRFEAAHVDRPADHFHRIGRIILQKLGSE